MGLLPPPVTPHLYADEELQLVFRRHPLVLALPLFLSALAIEVGVAVYALFARGWPLWFFLFTIVVGVVIILRALLCWWGSGMALTTQRVLSIERTGFLATASQECARDSVQQTKIERKNIGAQLFRYGTIVFASDNGQTLVSFTGAPHPERMLEFIRE